MPPAIFISSRIEESMSWLPRRPARSADSSALRDHSRIASRMGRSAIPARMGSAAKLIDRRIAAMVR